MKDNEADYVHFMGIKISNINYEGISEKIRDHIGERGYICLTDTGNVIRASKDKYFSAAIKDSLLSIADGMPLVWYAKLKGCRRIERISGVELFSRLLMEDNDYKHFLLGDTDETLKKVTNKAKRINNKIQINSYSPPFKNWFDENDSKIMIDKANNYNSDIIWVHQNNCKLEKGVMIGVGAAFKYYIGVIKAPPKIVQKLGFQWFTRLLHNPERLRLYFRTIVVYFTRLPFELMKGSKRKN
jgi:N-acetylglucosaminyldiphosphoundecaprenol N-acetyl-beta-D-mannosaminyltransferase